MESVDWIGLLFTGLMGVVTLGLMVIHMKGKENPIIRSLFKVALYLNGMWMLGQILNISSSPEFFLKNRVMVLGWDVLFSSSLFFIRLVFLAAFIDLVEKVLGREISASIKPFLKKTLLVLTAFWFLGWLAILLADSRNVVDNLMIYTDILIFGSVIAISFYMLSKSQFIIDAPSKKAVRYLFSGFVFTFGLACFKWVAGGSIAGFNLRLEKLFLHGFVSLANILIASWLLIYGRSLRKGWGFRFPRKIVDVQVIADRYGITSRELDVVLRVCEGKSNREIADELFLSIETIKDYNQKIFQKTGVKNRTQLANIFNQAMTMGDPPPRR